MGIGASSPGAKIEAVASGAAGSNSNTTGSVWGSSHGMGTGPAAFSFAIRHSDSGLTGISGNTYATQLISHSTTSNALEIFTTGAKPLSLGTNATEYLKIDSVGAVFMPSLATSGTDNGTLKYNSSTGEIWVD